MRRRKLSSPVNTVLLDRQVAAEVLTLRRMEEGNRAASTLTQWRYNRLAGLYGRHIFVDGAKGTWEHKQRIDDPLNPGKTCWIVRHGRAGTLPPKKLLIDTSLRDFTVGPDIADKLIERDGGWTEPGEPI